MSNLLIPVDLAKDVFEVAVAKPFGKVIERKRLTCSFENMCRDWLPVRERSIMAQSRRTPRSEAG